MNLKKTHSDWAANRADPSQNNKKHKNNNSSALINAIGGMIEMAKAMIAADHDVMPEMDDHMNVELQDGLKDSGIGVPGVWGDMNPNAITKDETYDDACSTEWSGNLVTEPEVTVMTKDWTYGGDVVFSESEMSFVKNADGALTEGINYKTNVVNKQRLYRFVCSEMNFVKQGSVEESILVCCTSSDGEPGMSVFFTKESTIRVQQEALMETKNYMTDNMEHQAVVASPKMSTMKIDSTVVVQKEGGETVKYGGMADDTNLESKGAESNSAGVDSIDAESLKNVLGVVVVLKEGVETVKDGGMADDTNLESKRAGANNAGVDSIDAKRLKNDLDAVVVQKTEENEAHDEAVPLGCGDGNDRGGDYNMGITKAFSGSEVIKPTRFEVSNEVTCASPRNISDAEEVHNLRDFLLNGKGRTERVNDKMNKVNKKPGSKSKISSRTKYAGFLSKWMIPVLFIGFLSVLSGKSFAAILPNSELSEDEESISKASILDHLVTDTVTEPSPLLDKGAEKPDVSHDLDLDQTSLEEVVTDTAIEGNVLDRSTEMLNELSQRLLRGGRDINSVREISNVKDIVAPLLERIQNIRHSYNSGDKEKAASAIKAIVGDSTVISSSLSESSETLTSIQLRDVPDAQLLEFIEPQVLKQLDENTQELLVAIDDTLPNLKKISASKRKKRSFQTQKESSRSNQRFFASNPSEFGHNGGGAYSASHGDRQSYSKYFNHHQHIHQFLKDQTTGRTDTMFSSLHRHPFFTKHSDTIMAKHQLRLDALGEEVCAPVCKPDEWQCNCNKLFSCVSDMNEYSLSVLIAGGYIETDPMSNNFGNFTVSADAINLFDAEEGVKDKLKRIQDVAKTDVTMVNCKAVLSDLFTACDSSKGICTDPNIESFAVSMNQVCQVVNTPIKLKFETVGDEFDRFVDDSLPATPKPLSFELCKDFIVHFDRLYKAYDFSTNPMRRDPSVSLLHQTTETIFNHVQFPVNYWFPQDVRGVVDRTVWPTTSIKSSFTMVNPESGKAMTVSGTGCSAGLRIELEDHDPSNQRQRFRITDDGKILSDSCPTSFLSTTDVTSAESCTAGGLLSLQTASAKGQQWRMGANGSILLDTNCQQFRLGNLAISAIKDDDIENMIGSNVYVSLINPSSGMAISIDSCEANAPVKFNPFNKDETKQRFKLIRSGEKLIIQNKHCEDGKASVLSLRNCASEAPGIVIGPREVCIKVKTGTTLLFTEGYINVYVDSGDGYKLETKANKLYVNGETVLEKCYDDYRGIQVQGPSIVYWYGTVQFSTDGKKTWNDMICKDGCVNKNTMPMYVTAGNSTMIMTVQDATVCLGKNVCTLAPKDDYTYYRLWKIGGGSIENDECGTVAGIPNLNFPPSPRQQITVADDKESWNQQWRVIIHEPVLVTENDGPYQEWKAHFTDPPYDFALLPGFPGYIKQVKLQFVQVKLQQTTGDYLNVFEVQVFDSTGNNVAKGKTATSSSVHENNNQIYGPQKAVDGDLTTYFFTKSKNDGDANPWLNINLGASCQGCKIVIHNRWCIDKNDSQHRCLCRLSNANLMLYDGSGTVVTTINVGNTCGRAILEYDLPPPPEPEIAKTAMNRCDESMALLVGSQTSLGTLKAIADLVTSEGPERMPGQCCFDTPNTNDKYLGVDYDPTLMACKNKGPFHLGISEEACENAGGKWFRTPCITLKKTVDQRPPRFDMNSPKQCQDDSLEQMNLAYVALSTSHSNFPFEHTGEGCLKFCRTLPGYSNQRAMMTIRDGGDVSVANAHNDEIFASDEDKEVSFAKQAGVGTCVCLFEDGLLPKPAELPDYVTRSPPAFYLTDSDGGSLGIPMGYDCNANEIPIEYQRNGNSTRSQFRLSYDKQLVSATCPNKALVADCARKRLAFSDSQTGADTWLLNEDGSITSAKCPNLKLSSTKSSINVLTSNYFSLVNPTTGLVMGIENMSGGCVNGMNIVLQNAAEDNPNQLFHMKDGSGEIISLACPKSALSVSDASTCDSSTSVIQLKTSDGKSTWQFNNDTTIQSISQCKDKVIDVMTTGTNLSDIESLNDLRASSGKYTVTIGTSLVISNYTEVPSMYQKWIVSRQQFTILSGPFSFVDSAKGLAMSLADDTCALGTALKMQADSYNDKKQQFYLGSSGAMYSVLCPGLEVTASGAGSQLTLQSVTREDNPKWKFLSDGSIESFKTGNKIEIVGSTIILEGSALQPNYIPKWNKVNTCLLTTSDASSSNEWNQNWTVNFVEAFDGSILGQTSDIGAVGSGTCYTVNEGFSPSFEDFARDLAIDDASDEDQCRKARELLGYDRDYSYDTEVRDRFNDKACGIDHTAVDHMIKPLAKPPSFTEIEFEAPEYPDDPELTFETLPTYSFKTVELWDEEQKNAKDGLAHTLFALTSLKDMSAEIYTFKDDAAKGICQSQPEQICLGPLGCVPNPMRFICWIVNGILSAAFHIVSIATKAAMAILQAAIYGMEKSKDPDVELSAVQTYTNFETFNTYIQDSLNIINKNIFTQHSEMRGHLQDRHQAMTNDIVGFIEESTNTIGDYFTLQTNWLHENLCTIYNAVKPGACTSTDDMLLLSKVGLHMWEKMLQIEEQVVSLMKMIETSQMADGSNVSQNEEGDANLKSTHSKFKYFLEKVDAVEIEMKMMKEEMKEVKDEMQDMKETIDSEMQEVKEKMQDVKNEVQEVKKEMQEMKDMMSKMMGMMAK